MCTTSSLDRYQGCLVGALVGDCLGCPFEGHCWQEGKVIPKDEIVDKIGPEKMAEKSKGCMCFTDDTAMAKSVSASLLHCKQMDSVDMATRFTQEYFADPYRGYGANVIDIFRAWKDLGEIIHTSNVLEPSVNQFDGTGSYGNGGAMRVAPVALFVNDVELCIGVARDSARLTHNHSAGYMGTILQALSVYQALHSVGKINWKDFLQDLRSHIGPLESELATERREMESAVNCDGNLYEWTRSKSFSYMRQLDVIEELLTAHFEAVDEYDGLRVVQRLGRDVSAQQAVPTALYCFLRNLELGFTETLYYSISLGGDTDTIGTMCAAMAGAYYGYSNIASAWKIVSESHDEVLEFANKFHERLASS